MLHGGLFGIKEQAESLKASVGLINIQWTCHGWVDRNDLQSMETSGEDHIVCSFSAADNICF